jgi:hypothetical protein
MKQHLVIALLALICFGAGFAAREMTETGPAIPPPPGALGAEFQHGAAVTPASDPHGHAPAPAKTEQPLDRAKMLADIERLRPQIETYRKRLDEIDLEFDHDLAGVLTADQNEKYTVLQKKRAERRAKGEAKEAADTTPLSDEQIVRKQQGPLYNVLGSVAISMRLDSLNHDLKLDEAQQAKVQDLLRLRRQKFLTLVDSVPPPTIMLNRLAPIEKKLRADPTPGK